MGTSGLITLKFLAASVLLYASAASAAADLCELPNGGQISGKVSLTAGCTYIQPIVISTSGTELDCKGAILDGRGDQKVGILITSRRKPLSDVVVKNCTVNNFRRTGIMVNSTIPLKGREDREAVYRNTPTNVLLDRVVVLNSGDGVYFNGYVTNSTLQNSTVKGSKQVGVYLSQASKNIKVINNDIEGNGIAGKKAQRREGLAVDSSADNLIEGNRFTKNGAGGLFLYKNCGTLLPDGKRDLRWQSSNNNVIRNNVFKDERVGVWIASRQSQDLTHLKCADPAVDATGKYFEDFANNNTVTNNKFCGGEVGVRIEGDQNNIVDNQFGASLQDEVVEPFQNRSKPDGRRTTGNQVVGSKKLSCQ